MAVNLHDEVRSNRRKSIFIVLLFFVFIGFIGLVTSMVYSLYAKNVFLDFTITFFIMILIVMISLIYVGIFMSAGDKMVLSATGAKEASRTTYPFLYHTTEALSLAAGMSVPPKCYVIEDTALNAYATGFKPEKSYIVVTTGLVEKLNRQELEGVIAHELSHIKNKDIKVMLLAAGLVGATVLLADLLFRIFIYAPKGGGGGGKKGGQALIFIFALWALLVIFSPIIGEMIKLAISRKREYLADSNGALLTRYPQGLASALEKIKNDPDPLVDRANKATAHLFISTPFRDKHSFINRLFSTHPPIDDRIAKLLGKKA